MIKQYIWYHPWASVHGQDHRMGSIYTCGVYIFGHDQMRICRPETGIKYEIRAKRYSQQKVKGRSFPRPSDRLRQLMATAMSRRHVTRMLESGHVTGWSPGRWPGGCAFLGLGSGWGSPWWCGWLLLPPCGTNPSPGGEWRPLSQRMSVCVG